MDFTALTVELLKGLHALTGNWGLAIIVLTVIVRAALWPLGVQQQRSMRAMQLLQPEMKRIQERYKSDPQTMQRKTMEFYKEHKFNPMSGCLPLLIQMPVFILLYSALISPSFIQISGGSHFLFIDGMDKQLRGAAAPSYDGKFSISGSGDEKNFVIYNKKVKVRLGDEEIDGVKTAKNALKIQGSVQAGSNIDFKIKNDDFTSLNFDQLEKLTSADIEIQNMKTREIENVHFERKDGIMAASMPSVPASGSFNADVFVLILIFAATMLISQKVMMSMNKNQNLDPASRQMQKMMGTVMPVMMIFMFVMIPIPAGVFLYMIVSNIFQIVQTAVINKQIENEELQKHAARMAGSDLSNMKTIKAVETKTIEQDKK